MHPVDIFRDEIDVVPTQGKVAFLVTRVQRESGRGFCYLLLDEGRVETHPHVIVVDPTSRLCQALA